MGLSPTILGRVGRTPYRTHSLGDGSKCRRGKGLKTVCLGPTRTSDIYCNPTCPIILGRPFLRTIGAIIDMKEGNIRFQFPLRKGMENFPRNKIIVPYESII